MSLTPYMLGRLGFKRLQVVNCEFIIVRYKQLLQSTVSNEIGKKRTKCYIELVKIYQRSGGGGYLDSNLKLLG